MSKEAAWTGELKTALKMLSKPRVSEMHAIGVQRTGGSNSKRRRAASIQGLQEKDASNVRVGHGWHYGASQGSKLGRGVLGCHDSRKLRGSRLLPFVW
jgi:hypothetical protein